MATEELRWLYRKLLPGSAPTISEDDTGGICPAAEALASALLELNMKLSQDEAQGIPELAEECAKLLAKLPPFLGLDPQEEDSRRNRAQALPSFIWLGLIHFGIPPSGVITPGSLPIWAPLRVLGRLVVAATAKKALRNTIGFPAMSCGVDLIKNLKELRPDCMPPSKALQEFAATLIVDVASHPSFVAHDMEGGCPCCQARHEWFSSLMSARAELAVYCPGSSLNPDFARGRGPLVPRIVVAAYEAAADALEACSLAEGDTELCYLLSTARLFSLTQNLADSVVIPAPEPRQMLRQLDKEDVMYCHILVLKRILGFLFPSALDDSEQHATCSCPDTQDKLCDSLADVLGSVRLFLELELQVEMFIHVGGIGALARVFEVYVDRRGRLGHVEHRLAELMLIVAECFVAVLGSHLHEEAQHEFMAASGFQQFLALIGMMRLRPVVDVAVYSGRREWWQLLCASMRVLEMACQRCPAGRRLFVREGGIATLVKATCWDLDAPGSCGVSNTMVNAEAQMAPQTEEMEDLVCSVATHAFAVVARVCVGQLDEPVDGSDTLCRDALLRATSLEEMEQLLSMHEAIEREQSGTPKTSSMNKMTSELPLPSSVIICSHMLLSQHVQHQELFMQRRYPLLYQTHLRLVNSSEAGGAQPMAKSMAFATITLLMMERDAWRQQLVKDKVHLAAGATLAAALTSLKHEALATRKARLHKLQARSRCGIGGGGKCGCGQPGCPDARIHWGDDKEDAKEAREAAERAGRVTEATSLILVVAKLLAVLREAGRDSQSAVLEVLNDGGKLAAAVAEGPSLTSISADLKLPEASLKEFVAWGQQQQQQPGGKRLSVQQAEEAAAAAAAALLAEEEAAQSKAAAKAAKRQRQRAAKQQAGQGRQKTGAAPEADVEDMEIPKPAHDGCPVPAANGSVKCHDQGTSSAIHGSHAAQDSDSKQPTTPDRRDNSPPAVDLLEAPQPAGLPEAERLGQMGRRGGNKCEERRPVQPDDQPVSTPMLPAGSGPGRIRKLRKVLTAKQGDGLGNAVVQQAEQCPGSLQQPGDRSLPAAFGMPAGSEQASSATVPVLAAILGPAASSGPESSSSVVPAPLTPAKLAAAARRTAPAAEPPLPKASLPAVAAAGATGAVAPPAEHSQAEAQAEAPGTTAVNTQELGAQATAEGAPAPAARHCACCGATPGPGVKLKLCSGCRMVRFCGAACQKAAWPGHKAACRASQQKD